MKYVKHITGNKRKNFQEDINEFLALLDNTGVDTEQCVFHYQCTLSAMDNYSCLIEYTKDNDMDDMKI